MKKAQTNRAGPWPEPVELFGIAVSGWAREWVCGEVSEGLDQRH